MTATWKRHLISIAGCTALAACGPEEDTVATDTTERAHSNWCDPPNPPDTYDFYPGTGTYTSGSAATYPWAGDDFESYADGETIECSSNKSLRTHLETTSGCLTAEHPAPTYKRGYMVDEARVLAQGLHGGTATSNRVKWTAQTNELRFWVASTYAPGSGEPSTQGPSLFARYRTENDLYVATARFDTDEIVLKEKLCGQYAELASVSYPLAEDTWYWFKFSAIGSALQVSVNDVVVISVTDGTFSWGTSGVRNDNADTYIDDWDVY